MPPLKIAHRGNTAHWPENTLEGIVSAIEFKVDGIEFDVQLTKDLQPVLFHDDTLNRLLGIDGEIFDYTFEELERFSLEDDVKIPHLEKVLEVIPPESFIYLEVKVPTSKNLDFKYIHLLCKSIIKRIEPQRTHGTIGSFHPMVLDHFEGKTNWKLTGILEEDSYYGIDDFIDADYWSIGPKLPRVFPEKSFLWGGTKESDQLALESDVFGVISDHWIDP
jgi:glycerophosphoryl diester phosphodiesterase